MRFISNRGDVDNDDEYDILPKQRRYEEQREAAQQIDIIETFEEGNIDVLKGTKGVTAYSY